MEREERLHLVDLAGVQEGFAQGRLAEVDKRVLQPGPAKAAGSGDGIGLNIAGEICGCHG
jgi:hypothetical protein